MSNRTEKARTQTNRAERKKAVEELRKKSPKRKEIVIGSISDNNELVVDDTPFHQELISDDYKLKNIMFSLGEIKPRELTGKLKTKSKLEEHTHLFALKEGVTKVKDIIKLPAGSILSVSLDHHEEFEAKDVYFTALIVK